MTDYTKPVVCHGCKKLLANGAYMQMDGEWWHTQCYRKANPPKPFTSFVALIRCPDDRVLMCDAVINHTPDHIKDVILESYNKKVLERYKRSIS